jgi:hypothetical protein
MKASSMRAWIGRCATILWTPITRRRQSSNIIRTASCSPLRPYFSDYRLGSQVLKGLANARKRVQRKDAN